MTDATIEQEPELFQPQPTLQFWVWLVAVVLLAGTAGAESYYWLADRDYLLPPARARVDLVMHDGTYCASTDERCLRRYFPGGVEIRMSNAPPAPQAQGEPLQSIPVKPVAVSDDRPKPGDRFRK